MNIKVIKKNVKNIYIRIKPSGIVTLSVPLNTSDEYIQLILKKRKNWIEKHLNYFKENYKLKQEKNYDENDCIKYLGKKYYLKLIYSNIEKIILDEYYLYMYTTKIDNRTYKKELLNQWYLNRSTEIFNEIIDKYLKIVKEPVKKVTIKSMKTRWGSCNYLKNTINLNLKLIEKPKIAIEYVIFHELAHLKFPNHSKMFYEYIFTYMPDYKDRINKLK